MPKSTPQRYNSGSDGYVLVMCPDPSGGENEATGYGFVLAMLPMNASALSLICQDKISTLAEWVNGQWVQAKFDGGTYTLTDQVSEAGVDLTSA